MPRGKKLRNTDVLRIRQLAAHGRTNEEIMRITGFSLSTVNRCKKGERMQLADGSYIMFQNKPKARKPEADLQYPLPTKPIQIKASRPRSHFEGHKLVDGPKESAPIEAKKQVEPKVEVKKQVESQVEVTRVFNYLLNLSNSEYKVFVKNVRKARIANSRREAVMARFEAQRKQVLGQA